MVKKLNAYLRLVRFPNLFTVPGDILIGYVTMRQLAYFSESHFSEKASVWMLVLISLAIYSFGLVLNDIVGLKEDREMGRSKRPLVSGEIKPKEASCFAVFLLVLAITLAAFINLTSAIVTLLLCLCVVLYNCVFVNRRFGGSVMMGMCRALNIILGASLGGFSAVELDYVNNLLFIAALFHFFYIFSVTFLAFNEEKDPRVSRIVNYAPAAVVCFLLVFVTDGHLLLSAMLLLVISLCYEGGLVVTPKKIGSLINFLVVFQFFWLVIVGKSIILGFLILIFVYLNKFFALKFYQS